MDVQRPDLARKNKRKRQLQLAGGALTLAALALFFLLFKPGPKEVEKNLVFTAKVERGEMLQQLRGTGELVPAEVRWVSAEAAGRIERIHVLQGTLVEAETLIMELSNPQLLQQLRDAQLQVKTQEANFLVRKAQLDSNLLQSLSALKRIESDYKQAELNARIDKQLFERGLEAEQTSLRSTLRFEQLGSQLELEQKRYEIASDSVNAEILAEKNRLEQAETRYALLQDQVDGLKVVAGTAGMLQRLVLKEGQQVQLGQSLAQVINPNSLKAEIRVPEHQAKQLQLQQAAEIDTRNGKVNAVVSRIDSNVQNGSVQIDLEIEDELPKGARPNSSIEAVVEVSRIDDVLHVSRPVYAKSNTQVSLFKLNENGDEAEQVKVNYGRASINAIEITQGLKEGDTIIISDVGDWINHDTLRLK